MKNYDDRIKRIQKKAKRMRAVRFAVTSGITTVCLAAILLCGTLFGPYVMSQIGSLFSPNDGFYDQPSSSAVPTEPTDPSQKKTEAFVYVLLNDKTYGVKAGDVQALDVIEIPNSYNGLPVTQIMAYGFANAAHVRKIIIPSTVTTIGKYAFTGCISLTSVEMPDTVTKIGEAAFSYCEQLPELTIPQGVSIIENFLFDHCVGMTSVTIPETVKHIKDEVFDYCENLKDIHYTGSFMQWTKLYKQELWDSRLVDYWIHCIDADLPKAPAGEVPGTEGLEYVFLEDGTFGVKASETLQAATIEIPSTYLGVSVTLILPGGFENYIKLKNITIPNSVTVIGEGAFSGCTGLTSITIPNSVTVIGEGAFRGCSSLTYIATPGGVTQIEAFAFQDCVKLERVTLTKGLHRIEANAFAGCIELSSFKIPDTVTFIAKNMLFGCTKVRNLTYSGSLDQWDAIVKEDSWCDGILLIKVICSDANYYPEVDGTPGMGYELLEDGTLGVRAGDARLLKEIVIPSEFSGRKVTQILSRGFRDATNLVSITIPNSITNISYNAFYGCNSLTSIVLPDGITTISEGAFSMCSNLSNIVIPDGVTVIEKNAFYRCGISNIILPNSVTRIEESAFSRSSLISIIIPESVTSIGTRAFMACSKLISVTLPDGIKGIEEETFSGCNKLTEVNLPNSLKYIRYGAFYNCVNLTRINYNGTKAQWNSVNKDVIPTSVPKDAWDCATGKYIVYCTDGQIKKSS